MLKLKYLSEIKEKTKSEDNVRCILGEICLIDYIENLPKNFQEYDIQRDIVSNEYLDKLIDTVINNRHIPNITLVCNESYYGEKENELSINHFKILDGLQRTYRLKVIYDTYKLLLNKVEKSYDFEKASNLEISKYLKNDLREINSSFKLFKSILECYLNKYNKNIDLFKSNFMNQQQWVEVWFNLSINDEIEKMLMLNAGHKSVTNEHQIELIIMRAIPELQHIQRDNIKIIRDKGINIAKFSKERNIGEYHLSNIITSVLAYSYAKPIKLDRKLILNMQNMDIYDHENVNLQFMNIYFIDEMLEFLYKLDNVLYEQYENDGIRWISRKTVLVSLFAALGCYKDRMNPNDIFNDFIRLVEVEKIIDIKELESVRNNIDLSKVNIGDQTKNKIYTFLLNKLSKFWGDGYSNRYNRL